MARTNREARSTKRYTILCIPGREPEELGTWFAIHRDSHRPIGPACGLGRTGRLAAIEIAAKENAKAA